MTQFIKYACAPIAWTNDDLPELGKENSFEQCISEMALAGYEGTEIGNKYPKDAEVLKSYLKPRNLSVASAWLSLYLTTKPYEETEKSFIDHMNFLKALGAKVIVVSEQGKSIQGDINCPLFKFKPTFNDEEWKKLIDGLHRFGSIARDNGMKIVYHHHMGTGVQTTEEIKRLMDATDPKLVSLLYDTGHLHFSGEDVFEIFKTYKERIHHIHFKDTRGAIIERVKKEKLSFLEAVKQGAFTVPGDGDIDFKPILEMIQESDYAGWIVVEAEQDPAVANPFVYAKKAKEYINAI
ncbi:myo-inosose-2 dehydratase [Staphylococcus pseudintermedius]|uniref:myo-inosose-2 dehydratase n=1 Tax=Staphylococcus pseudintermedius TaxID=283734 RepID=UPI000BBCB8E9|nr:myo-inosose-2 dehydratase [Staphylococcus pseudintermedius]EGQ1643590.1 myo-inosose-2 dehydratase [Staphylococcus pseudintermedius]EGQ1658392.1 myo-inosose-2 dehydratase [Staphylococcus pseudintermedius]EGQ1713727.1 myo-inosose-2 dehydratase [Staphylococcus pseudintermedius]EGQ1752071.1 myo-inosose-2 dehydratase [Staphylococcus pseudintermedius]EGQ2715383.1 myo-inosose-2 dehydratase [Staphylococcus pseudintermedius]